MSSLKNKAQGQSEGSRKPCIYVVFCQEKHSKTSLSNTD